MAPKFRANQKLVFVAIATLLFSFPYFAPNAFAMSPAGIMVVDSNGGLGNFCSLALDSNGNPHISYFLANPLGNNSLEYASWTGSVWDVQTVDGNRSLGPISSLALDPQNNPHIVYQVGAQLSYAVYNGSAWIIQAIGLGFDNGSYISLAMDSNGYAYVSYQEASALKCATLTSQGMTTTQTVDSNGVSVGNYNSITLDPQGHPYIAYMTTTSTSPTARLKYATFDGSVWHNFTVDASSANEFFKPSIAVNSTGSPRIAYYRPMQGAAWGGYTLHYASTRGNGWSTSWGNTAIDQGNFTGQGNSLALDSQGNPHISYYGDQQLHYAYYDGSEWHVKLIEKVGNNTSQSTSIAIDKNDQAHIAYYDSVNHQLKYIHITDPNIYSPPQYLPPSQPITNQTSQPTPTPRPPSPDPVLGSIRIMPNGTVQGTNQIKQVGNTYTLTGDINLNINDTFGPLWPALVVMKDDVVVDGAGHTIQSNGTGLGVYVRGFQGVTVENLVLKGFTTGIDTYIMDPVAPLECLKKTTSAVQFLNNTIQVSNSQSFFMSELSGYGIYVEFGSGTIISGNTIQTQDPTKGIYIGWNCNGTTISNNKLIGCGLNLYTLKQTTMSGNTIDGKPIVCLQSQTNQTVKDAQQVFLNNCNQITVQNIAPQAGYRAVQLDQSIYCTVTKCSGDIALRNSHNNQIIQNTPHQIILTASNNNKIYQNAFEQSGQCIILQTSCGNDIWQNNLLDSKISPEAAGLNYEGKNPSGIQFAYSDNGNSQNNLIRQNRITNCVVGIENSVNNKIYNNLFDKCSVAVTLYSGNQIYENNITNCGQAISICGNDNAIYHNNFLNNTGQVAIYDSYLFTSDIITAYSVNNVLDDGYPSGGNYWSSFRGSDTNGDGLSETPYVIDNRTIDRYPCMKPLALNITLAPITQADPTAPSTQTQTGVITETQQSTTTPQPIKHASEETALVIALAAILPAIVIAILFSLRKNHAVNST